MPPLTETAELIPLSEETEQDYLEIYNRCFQTLPGAAAYRALAAEYIRRNKN